MFFFIDVVKCNIFIYKNYKMPVQLLNCYFDDVQRNHYFSYSTNSFTISIFFELGIFWIFPIVVDSFNGIYPTFLLLAFTKSNIKLKVYEPTYWMGPVGCETNLTYFGDPLLSFSLQYGNIFCTYKNLNSECLCYNNKKRGVS